MGGPVSTFVPPEKFSLWGPAYKIDDQGARGGVLEDVLGLEDTFWTPWPWPRKSSPWPWPRGLKSSKIALFSARSTALFFEVLKFCRSPEKKFWKTFFTGERLKKIYIYISFFLNTCACVLGLERVCRRKGCPWPRICFMSLALALSLVSSTPPLSLSITLTFT